MIRPVVRLEKIWIKNFKNVVSGEISFENNRKPYSASILGLYGQNGSGKTALIDAAELLKFSLSGRQVPSVMADFINADSDSAQLKYEFKVTRGEEVFNVFYEFNIKKEIADDIQNVSESKETEKKYKTAIFDEVLSYAYTSPENKCRLSVLIDTRASEIFGPKVKYDILVGKRKEDMVDLMVIKRFTFMTSRTFIFSKELLNTIRKQCELTKASETKREQKRHLFVLESLVEYGNFSLFVINTSNTGLTSRNTLPLAFKYEEKNQRAVGLLAVNLNGATTIPEKTLEVVKKVIENMNIVLSQIIPGLTIGIMELERQVMENGQTGTRIQLVSYKNHKEIALRYESEGIKKIISILQLLIVVYNYPSITVAIDELDTGVFEYLLGELLKIISEKGKGQLIFTSHNLRPLETLDRGFIAFTTTNPKNRYIRFNNVKDNNNLRDFYFRDIVLREQSEEVYEPTNNYEIALAFKEASNNSGS